LELPEISVMPSCVKTPPVQALSVPARMLFCVPFQYKQIASTPVPASDACTVTVKVFDPSVMSNVVGETDTDPSTGADSSTPTTVVVVVGGTEVVVDVVVLVVGFDGASVVVGTALVVVDVVDAGLDVDVVVDV